NCLPIACCRFVAIFLFLIVSIPASAASSETISFDSNWRFFQGNATGAEAIQFDDSAWRVLNVPHDWSIEGPFAETNATRGSGAFLPSGIAWYRKSFSLNSNTAGRSTWVEFDGVMANSDVWINGQHLGHRPNGYVSFHYDLTPFLNPAGTNVISV